MNSPLFEKKDSHGASSASGAEVAQAGPAAEVAGQATHPGADLVGATGPEFRMDPLSGEWVIIAGGRQARPSLPKECPFCIGGLEAPNPYTVKAFTNRWPVMRSPADLGLRADQARRAMEALDPFAIADSDSAPSLDTSDVSDISDLSDVSDAPEIPNTAGAGDGSSTLYRTVPALGEAEVVLYTPRHDGSLGSLADSELEALWELWRERTFVLAGLDHVAYVLIFENRGAEVGVTIEHPHGQIYGFPYIPPRIAREIAHRSSVATRSGIGCIACELVLHEPKGSRLVYEDDHSVAYVPYASAWPYALHLLPKRHAASLLELDEAQSLSLMRLLRASYAAADRLFDRPLPTMMAFLQKPFVELPDSGASNADWHLRIELVSPMRKRDVLRYVAGAEVATSVYQNPISPEEAAHNWRTAFDRATRGR
jgi:UDPglucose--hexose-1-phosphate uridylyltransferase